ncbi:MAG: starch-binding protein, partial [Rhodomicrobium sp.]
MTDLIVHFRRPAGWANTVRIHYWNTRPEDQRTQWPGAAMLAERGGWFVRHFADVEAASLVFTDGAGRQTGDLWRDRGGWYRHGRWYDSHPDQISASPAQATPISAAPEGGSSAEAIGPKPAPSA